MISKIQKYYYLNRRRSKEEQETEVGEALLKTYNAKNGTCLILEHQGDKDPPDIIFKSTTIEAGVEVFEIEQAYFERVLKVKLLSAFYKKATEFGLNDKRYDGVCISLAAYLNEDTRLDSEKVAEEVITLFKSNISDRSEVPEFWSAKLFYPEQSSYPNLCRLRAAIAVWRIPDEAIAANSDNKTLRLLPPITDVNDKEIIRRVRKTLLKKISDRSRWNVQVEKSILLIHDYSREFFFEGWGRDWETIIKKALIGLNSARFFDELYLVELGKRDGEIAGMLYCRKIDLL